MIPLLASLAIPLVKTLMDEGLNLAASAIRGGGSKAKEFIEEKTGLDLNQPDKLTKEDFDKIKSLEANPEYQTRLKELALEELKEKNRSEEAKRDDTLDDVKSARDMYQSGGVLQDKIATKVLEQTKWIIPLLFVFNIIIILTVAVGKLDSAVGASLASITGVAIGHSYNERKTLVEFAFGGSLKGNGG